MTVDGKPHHPYAVFINARNGKRGLVVCNYDEKKTIIVQATLDDGGCPARYRLVDDPTWRAIRPGGRRPTGSPCRPARPSWSLTKHCRK
ncbi:MAG: hypothetical protein NT169_03815 [Chloroflexi bacterium]|nr:hypothetical protein [Chloroflexota bacterium]